MVDHNLFSGGLDLVGILAVSTNLHSEHGHEGAVHRCEYRLHK
jgi:hypothetical protein